ncbi:PAS domain S-box protein [Methanohalophilus portucalensis FDF-1]|uniref:histidine kinase n=3 Tax=Methanohalophilus portucalensis TaxID=39664 RepID=A0A1L9C7C5_9EURY|nr:hypothetical protein BKM01_09010 [Methanohalophilus portucalensis]OJH50298.1 PAS sensor protein [Methanohalophilus portucalensis FDF-1]RNI11259.1 PAS domain S-box protein [Methanohalophilus portucalensis FDF-1]
MGVIIPMQDKNQEYENPIIVFLWNAEKDWPVEFVSDNIQQFGYNAEDFISGDKTYAQIIHPHDIDEVRENIRRICKEGIKEYTHRYRILTADDQERWVMEKTLVERDIEDEPCHFQGFVMDITGQMDSEEMSVDMISTKSPVVAFVWKVEKGWPVEYVSDEIEKYGYTTEEFLSGNLNYGDIIHKDDLKRVEDELSRRCREGYNDFYQEYRIYTKEGQIRKVAERTLIIRDEHGNPSKYQGIIEDL